MKQRDPFLYSYYSKHVRTLEFQVTVVAPFPIKGDFDPKIRLIILDADFDKTLDEMSSQMLQVRCEI